MERSTAWRAGLVSARWAGLFSHPEEALPAHFLAWGLFRALFRSSGFGVSGRRKKQIKEAKNNLTGHIGFFHALGLGV